MYQEAFKLDPQNATSKSKLAGAYNARGLDYKSTEDMDAAVKDFKAALRLFPDNADYQANYNSVKAWDQ
jgi:tetratricopeptide (TPR) repeat protein